MTKPTDTEVLIATHLDHPSVYMGGPSAHSLRKARRLIESLQHAGYQIVPVATIEALRDHFFVDECQECAIGQSDAWRDLISAIAPKEKP